MYFTIRGIGISEALSLLGALLVGFVLLLRNDEFYLEMEDGPG